MHLRVCVSLECVQCVFVCAAGGACAYKHKNRHADNAHMHTKRTQSLHLLSVRCFWVGLTSVFIGRYFVLVQASSTLAEADSLVNVTLRGELKKIRFNFFVL